MVLSLAQEVRMQSDIEKALTLIEAALDAGIQPTALRDAIPRGLQALQELSVDITAARHWVESVRHSHPSYFGQGRATAGVGAAPTPALTPAQVKALEGLSPTERMTQYRLMQQRQVSTKASGTE
jgi:hypothetical protein